MRFESKSAPALAVAGLLTAALIALSGCASDSGSSSDPETTPTATLDVVEQGFDSLDELSDYVAQSLDGVEVSLESETNPDFNQETEPERLHVHFASTEDKVKDLEATAFIVQATSRAGFDRHPSWSPESCLPGSGRTSTTGRQSKSSPLVVRSMLPTSGTQPNRASTQFTAESLPPASRRRHRRRRRRPSLRGGPSHRRSPQSRRSHRLRPSSSCADCSPEP